MALARVVTFDGVGAERLAQVKAQLEEEGAPEGFPPAELVMLHDASAGQALVLVFVDNDDDYRRADEILGAMAGPDTPGRRTSVTRYDVVARAKN